MYKIREATIQDVNKIHKLGENVEEFDTTEEVVSFWPKQIILNCIESNTDWLFLAEKDEEIVGFIICNNSPVFKKAVIENLYVNPEHRNQGIGKQLLDLLITTVKSAGCEYVALYTESENKKSIDFYIKNGFNRGKDFAWIDLVLSEEFSKK
jgi:ribosomal protein S18 acetylase RimI-like enzyme